MSNIILSCKNLNKSYHDAKKELLVLNNINFELHQNQLAAILGVSGSGKSTFLHLLGGLDYPTSGEVLWHNNNIYQLSEKRKCHLRNSNIGFVYQFHYLLPEFSAIENVAMPLLIGGMSFFKAQKKAGDFLEKIGLKDRKHHKIGELSGGERQRVAIARALITRPACVLADEPTGNLDKQTSENVLSVMLELQKELGTSFLIATHDLNLAKKMQKCYLLEKGNVFEG